jgi:hypothetical protein
MSAKREPAISSKRPSVADPFHVFGVSSGSTPDGHERHLAKAPLLSYSDRAIRDRTSHSKGVNAMQQFDHRVIKFLIGVIAVFIAFFMQTVSGEVLRSISESYHYRARDWFVGLLFVEAALILSFSGINRFERILTIVASIFAAAVAVAPCDCGRGAATLSFLHFPAAAGLFVILGYFCWRFRKTAKSKAKEYPEANKRVHVYSVCLIGIVASLLMGAVYAFAEKAIDATFPNYVFWLEALGLVSFGVSWLAASRTIPVITNPKERYSIPVGRAPEDGEDPARDAKRAS